MRADGSRPRLPALRPAAVAAAALTLLLVPRAPARPGSEASLAGLSGPRSPPRRGPPARPGAAAAVLREGAGLLDELVRLSTAASEEELGARVDAEFGRLVPDDLNALQGRLAAAADEDSRARLQRLTGCIQASMERRMEQAKSDIDSLLMSSGDIDENVRGCLERQDSPLPILAVLQMNIGKAKRDGLQKQERALMFLFSKINGELERRAPPANRVLTRMLGLEDGDERRRLLRRHLAEAPADGAATPEDLADAIVQLVADVEARFAEGGGGFGGQTREGALGLVRQVALDAGVVVGEALGEGAQAGFSERLLPLFQALSK